MPEPLNNSRFYTICLAWWRHPMNTGENHLKRVVFPSFFYLFWVIFSSFTHLYHLIRKKTFRKHDSAPKLHLWRRFLQDSSFREPCFKQKSSFSQFLVPYSFYHRSTGKFFPGWSIISVHNVLKLPFRGTSLIRKVPDRFPVLLPLCFLFLQLMSISFCEWERRGQARQRRAREKIGP